MRTTLILDDALVRQASELTSIRQKTALVHAGLRALLASQAQLQLGDAGRSEPKLRTPRRRRPKA